jgi:broad specificity phosphatase PhoE
VSSATQLWLIRHGETEWSLSGAHTSRTDIPLTENGREKAKILGEYLKDFPFSVVLTSPMGRAKETCRIAGLIENAQVEEGLREWDYGIFEGKSTPEIRKTDPNFSIWESKIVDGESLEQVGDRADGVIADALEAAGQVGGGNVALFAHGHILRILAARWIDLPARGGERLGLGTGSVSVLGYERTTRVIQHWNRGFGG